MAICLCGFILFKALYITEILKTTSSESPGFRSIREALLALPHIIVRLWHAPSFWILAGLWLSALVALFLPIKHKLALFYLIFCVPWLVNVLGYFMSEDTLRYISGSLFFGIFMGISVFLYPLFSYLEKKTIRFSVTLSVCLVAIILLVIKQQQNYFYLYTPAYIREIEEFTKKTKADYVITDYWNARPVSFFTKDIMAIPMTKELYFYCHEADIRLYDSIMAIKYPKIALYTSNFDLDSLSVYRDYSFPAVPCFQDSLFLLNRNPIRGK